MEPKFRNTTNLTLDMYKQGIVSNYKINHRILRAFSTGYGIIMLFIAFVEFLYFDWAICLPFLTLGLVILFWNIWGYKLGTKKSFMKFANLHSSHFQVEMNYRFYQDRLEQETSKTELSVMYKDVDIVYSMTELLLIIFDKKVIIMDKKGFIDESYEVVIDFLKEKNVRVINKK